MGRTRNHEGPRALAPELKPLANRNQPRPLTPATPPARHRSIIKHLKLSCMPLKTITKRQKLTTDYGQGFELATPLLLATLNNMHSHLFFFYKTLQIYDNQKLQKATLTQTISKENHHYLLGKFDPKTFRRQKRVYAPRSSLSFTNKHKSAGGTRSQVYCWTTKTRRRAALCQD